MAEWVDHHLDRATGYARRVLISSPSRRSTLFDGQPIHPVGLRYSSRWRDGDNPTAVMKWRHRPEQAVGSNANGRGHVHDAGIVADVAVRLG